MTKDKATQMVLESVTMLMMSKNRPMAPEVAAHWTRRILDRWHPLVAVAALAYMEQDENDWPTLGKVRVAVSEVGDIAKKGDRYLPLWPDDPDTEEGQIGYAQNT